MEKLYYLQFQKFLFKKFYFSKLKKQYKIRNLFFSKTIAFSLFQGKIILGLYDN